MVFRSERMPLASGVKVTGNLPRPSCSGCQGIDRHFHIDFVVGKAVEDGLDHHAGKQPGQVRADAAVRAQSEGDVAVGGAIEDDRVRPVELVLSWLADSQLMTTLSFLRRRCPARTTS
ncbi:hypothetical protein A5700_17540 [Mycobacterium sp. E1214]|nr:hypothetical protein A5700_17540 [Mycobacterium sp. E1214]OBH29995.1 hypothetical protein A5693_18535 [Mycobacterium sp. E1319]